MGYMRSHAIIVESWHEEQLIAAHKFASSLFPWVSPISPPAINSRRSFLIPGDGSKEGWSESNDGDERRAKFKEHLVATYRYEDGSTSIRWVEVQFADDDGDVAVCDHDGNQHASP